VENTYCKPPETSDFEDACAEDDRYRAINACAYDRHSTLEVRLFSGSINADKIIQYLQVVSSIAYAEKDILPGLATADEWALAANWDSRLTKWVKDRATDLGNRL
jgi:hypothetical protein